MSRLEIQNLSVAYGKNEVLKNIGIDVENERFISIVGPSGCGKTTLLKAISGLITPNAGSVSLESDHGKNRYDKIGYIFQHYVSFPWLSVKENVMFGLYKIKSTSKRQETAQYFINAVGLKGYENAYISQLSGGMKQRVAIATVLARDPKILLMDEPFSSLDTQTKSLMQELLASIWEENKKTVLFVTHDIEEAIFLSDSVYVMSARPGTIKEVIEINLPRPRTANIKLSSDFFNIKKHLTYLVRSEAIKSADISLPHSDLDSLKIGVHAWPGNTPVYLAEQLGLFEKSGLKVKIVDLEKKQDRIASFINNEVDLFISTLDGAVLANEKTDDLKILAVLNQSVGADGLIVNKNIKNIKELKGKKIAIEKNWVNHFFLLYLLNQHGLSSKDIHVIHAKGSDIGALMISDKVDAAVTFEPWLTQAKNFSGGKILASTKEFPVIYDVLLAKQETIDKKGDEIRKFISEWFESVKYFQDNSEKSCTTIAHTLAISKSEFMNQMENLILYDEADNKKFFGANKKILIENITRDNKIWIDEHKMKTVVDAEKMFLS